MVKQVVGSMSDWSGVLKDFFRQIEDGSHDLESVKAFNEHQNPFSLPSDLLLDWQKFWERMGIGADLRNVKILKKPKGFDRLLVNPLTPQKAYDLCESKSKFKCWKYSSESLDKIIFHEDRSAVDGAYAIWVRERVEADEENKNRSANDLAKAKFSGITLTERLVYELKLHDETGKHLDISNWTLCSGSRDSGGDVPSVGWSGHDSEMRVSRARPSDAGDGLRS